MNTAGPPGTRRGLRAPRENGGRLIFPARHLAAKWLAANRDRLDGSSLDVRGQTLGMLRRTARREWIEAALRYTGAYRAVETPPGDAPLVLAGHQPEMFHPGVWFKNFVLGRVARAERAVAINLVIDSDTLKTPGIRVPGGDPASPVVAYLPYDAPADEIPYEERSIVDRDTFGSFGQRVVEHLRGLVSQPLAASYWPLVIEAAEGSDRVGTCLAVARHRLEQRLGNHTLELPQSRICELDSTRWMLVHLLADLPRLMAVHNQALAEFRRTNRIRSTHHPVPQLVRDGPWHEAPLWIWRADQPRRQRLFARVEPAQVVLGDRQGFEAALPLAAGDASAAVEVLARLAAEGIKLRTRALTTTLLARMLGGDLFLHGIGGGKYDELTDAIIARYFGLEPPGFMIVSGTLHLPVEREPVTIEALRALQGALREIEYHPERFLEGAGAGAATDPAAGAAVAAKRRWIETPKSPANAHQRHEAIMAANARLRPFVAGREEELARRQREMVRAWRAETILGSREYAFCLYPPRVVGDFLLEIGGQTP